MKRPPGSPSEISTSPWPIAGLPSILHCDNGAEFHSHALQAACREYGMKLQYRPPATPRFGGHIERLIGTMMGAIHVLPGTTFSNVKVRGDYDAEGRAIFTLRELEAWLTVSDRRRLSPSHPHNPAPAAAHSLARPAGRGRLDLPPDRMAFWTAFLPELRRRLAKDGIHFEKIRYWSDALSREVGRRSELLVKYDPRDLSRIFVRQPGGRFVEARYRNLAYPPVTWWEWKHTKKRLYEQGRRDLNEDVLFACLAHQRQIEDAAALATATARRQIARRPSKLAPAEDAGASVSGASTPPRCVTPTTTWSSGDDAA